MKHESNCRYEEVRRVSQPCPVVAEREIRPVAVEEMFERVAER